MICKASKITVFPLTGYTKNSAVTAVTIFKWFEEGTALWTTHLLRNISVVPHKAEPQCRTASKSPENVVKTPEFRRNASPSPPALTAFSSEDRGDVSSEALVTTGEATWVHKPQDHKWRLHLYKNLTSRITRQNCAGDEIISSLILRVVPTVRFRIVCLLVP
jgi:hypothetical protein